MASELEVPNSKKRKLEDSNSEEDMKVVLALCGSFNPITYLHLRLFGKLFLKKYLQTVHVQSINISQSWQELIWRKCVVIQLKLELFHQFI